MIPIIRSHLELMAITKSRDQKGILTKKDLSSFIGIHSAQSQRYIKSVEEKKVDLPNIPKIIRSKFKYNKKIISKFIDELDYNNQIQSSYELTLLERQNKQNHQDVA